MLVTLIGGLAGVGIMLLIMTKATSGPVEFETDNSVVASTTDSSDASADSDSDFDSDFDSDSSDDFGTSDESDDFDVSTNFDSPVDPDFIGVVDFAEYKNAFDLEFDLSDAEREIRKKHPGNSYRVKNIMIDKNENTDSGYNAIVRVDFIDYDDNVLRQEVTLSYDLDETFNNWDYKGYELTGEEKIYSDLEYFSVEQEEIPFEKKGTFVYEAINKNVPDKGQYRKLYVYYVDQVSAAEYDVSASCIVVANNQIISVDVINKTGEASVHPRERVRYDTFTNGLVRESETKPVFKYNEKGGMLEDRPYVRISDEILSPEEIVENL